MMSAVAIAAVTLVAVLLMMAGEQALSAIHERILLARGAGGADDRSLSRVMQWTYPSSFVAMALEGAFTGPSTPVLLPLGLGIFGVSKALKMWSMRVLGVRWTFRILVLPDSPPVAHGPYSLMRHPNYLAIIGELVGVALIVWAPVCGVLAVVGYGALLGRKIAVEDRALGRQ